MKISIITPSYNQAEYIDLTINSVLSQKGNFELEYIIIDGLSSDNTSSILERYNDNIKVIKESDDGQSDAVNKGFNMATGDIVGWLNSDDLYCAEALKKVCDYFNGNIEKQWAYGKCSIIDGQGKEIRRPITFYKNIRQRRFSRRRLFRENFISQPAVFFRRDFLLQAGPLNSQLQYTMDYDLWIRMAKLSTPGYIPFYLAQFRRHAVSKSETSYKNQFEEQYHVMKTYHDNPIDKAAHKLLNLRTTLSYNLLNHLKRK